MRQLAKPLTVIVVSVWILALVGCGSSSGASSASGGAVASSSDAAACHYSPKGRPSVALLYQLQPESQSVTTGSRAKTINVLCQRIRELGHSEARIEPVGTDQLRIVMPGSLESHQLPSLPVSTGSLYFYNWEPNLIGQKQAIGGHPGMQPPIPAFRKATAEWKAAGRNIYHGDENRELADSGAFPTAYDAALLASEQPPVTNCTTCSTAKPRYYLFAREAQHKLIAGPEYSKSGLYVGPHNVGAQASGIVLTVPAGTVLVSEQPTERSGKIDNSAQPGWYALRDHPALSGSEITEPQVGEDQIGETNVTFAFTAPGRQAFQTVTRQIAEFGRSQAIGKVSPEQASALSGHFAVVLDNEVKIRPIINFVQNPRGISGSTGAEISGGFNTKQQARELAVVLKSGATPLKLVYLRQIPDR